MTKNPLNCKSHMQAGEILLHSVTCQPTPRLRIEGGIGVALAYLDTAMKPPVDCSKIEDFSGNKLLSKDLLD